MALTATLYRFALELADIDRNVYESLDLRVAQHPSEDAERMVVRVLARAIAHEEGLDFGRGLSEVEDPALFVEQPGGAISLWIDVGVPSAERLHRANKRADRLMVFTHKIDASLKKTWSTREVHRPESIEIVQLPAELVRGLAEQLDRKITWYVTLQDGTVSVAQGESELRGTLENCSLAEFLARE